LGEITSFVNECGFDIPLETFFDRVARRLYVTDSNNDRLLVFDLGGGVTNGMPAAHVFGQTTFLTNAANQGCNILAAGSGFTNRCGVDSPFGIAGDAESQRFFLADSLNNRILQFSRSTL
jgi:DNA-binding beta-propeller fold protein YncE